MNRSEMNFYQGLEPADKTALLAQARPVCAAAKTVLQPEGDPATSFFVIEKGAVRVEKTDAEGDTIILGVLRQGAFHGLAPMFLNAHHPHDVIANSDVCLSVFRHSDIRQLMQDHPAVNDHILWHLSFRVRILADRLDDQRRLSVQAQIATLLLREGAANRDVSNTQTQIAMEIGASRYAVGQVLQRFQDAGAIKLGYRRIDILRPEILNLMV